MTTNIDKTLTNLGSQKYIAEQKMELLEKMKKINELIFQLKRMSLKSKSKAKT